MYAFKRYDSLWATRTFVRKFLHVNLPTDIREERPRHEANLSPPPVPSNVSIAIPPSPLNAIMACTGATLPLALHQFQPEKCIIKTYDRASSIIIEYDTKKNIRNSGSKSARSVGAFVPF